VSKTLIHCTIEGRGDTADTIGRYRALIKRLGRQYGLRITDHRIASPHADTTGRSNTSAMSGLAEASDAAGGRETGKAGKARSPP